MREHNLTNSGKTGPIGHEHILGRVVQPMARKPGLPRITWIAAPTSCSWITPTIFEESAEFAAEMLSLQLSGNGEKKADSATDSAEIGS